MYVFVHIQAHRSKLHCRDCKWLENTNKKNLSDLWAINALDFNSPCLIKNTKYKQVEYLQQPEQYNSKLIWNKHVNLCILYLKLSIICTYCRSRKMLYVILSKIIIWTVSLYVCTY